MVSHGGIHALPYGNVWGPKQESMHSLDGFPAGNDVFPSGIYGFTWNNPWVPLRQSLSSRQPYGFPCGDLCVSLRECMGSQTGIYAFPDGFPPGNYGFLGNPTGHPAGIFDFPRGSVVSHAGIYAFP